MIEKNQRQRKRGGGKGKERLRKRKRRGKDSELLHGAGTRLPAGRGPMSRLRCPDGVQREGPAGAGPEARRACWEWRGWREAARGGSPREP